MSDLTKTGCYCVHVEPAGETTIADLNKKFALCPNPCKTMPMARIDGQLVIMPPSCFIQEIEGGPFK